MNVIEEGGSPMSKIEMLREVLKGTDWEVREGDKSKLVEVEEGGVVICVDGRKPKGEYESKVVRGPKVQGGVEGVALLRAKTQGKGEIGEGDVREACNVVKEAGFKPGVHDLHEEVHCGHCKLLMQEKFADMPKLAITPQELAHIVGEEGGVHIELEGQHVEGVVRVNFVKGTTLEPNLEAFNLDAWAAEKFEIDLNILLGNAVDTVEGLNGPRVLEVFE